MRFEGAKKALEHGHANQCQDEAARAQRQYRISEPEWARKFLILEAQAALELGLNERVLELLASEPLTLDRPDLAISTLMLTGMANVNTGNIPEAKRSLDQAEKLCDSSPTGSCGYVLQARGILASDQGDSADAERLFQLSHAFARAHNDLFLEANSLLNLGAESLAQGRYDEAIDRSEVADQVAKSEEAGILELDIQGNKGWAYYKLGDMQRALDQFLSAEKNAAELGDVKDRGIWLTNAGYVYLDSRNFQQAEQLFRAALTIEQAPEVDSKENIYNARRALARLYIRTGNADMADQYADQAMDMAHKAGNRSDELYPLLVKGQVSTLRGNIKIAERTFLEVDRDNSCPEFLQVEAEHLLARLYEDEHILDRANREYQMAISSFEAARHKVSREDSQLSFLTNASSLYDDYIQFLVAKGKEEDALRWADYSRARTLSEGLGLLSKSVYKGAPSIAAQQIARGANGTILFYWLGQKQSYLWAITPEKRELFKLPPGPVIDAAVEKYHKALNGPQDVLAASDRDGLWLYRVLIAPAQSLFVRDAKFFIIPDGSLNNLNFETLLVSEPNSSEGNSQRPKLHYWIEDATVTNASSLRMLAASHSGKSDDHKGKRNLLLIGNSVTPDPRYPELPQAGDQMKSVAQHFPATAERVLTRDQATPAAYLTSHPEQFSYIHFAAHGTASRLSPLDSAIVLSRGATSDTHADDSFKLYARDIVQHPLRADLVTISACYGSGERAYAGEGLVGLSWAFLRAGSHNVVAALWEAADSSTQQLMDEFYEELENGASPDVALRAAKLSLLHGTRFRDPFYWAPFQLYTGS